MTTTRVSRSGNQGDQPLIVHASSVSGSSDQANVVTRELPTSVPGVHDWLLAIADPGDGLPGKHDASELAADFVQQALPASGSLDPAGGLRSAYRELNNYFLQSGEAPRQVSVVTAVTNGKYVTIANVGTTGAFLVRANRVNRITPIPPPESLAAQPGQRDRSVTGLGVLEKLDSRQPEIFEVAFLPEDLLFLCGGEACEVVAQLQSSQLQQLTSPDDASQPVALPVLGSWRGSLAALAVEPARELIVSAPVSEERSSVWLIVVVMLLAAMAVVAAFLLV